MMDLELFDFFGNLKKIYKSITKKPLKSRASDDSL